MNVWRITKHDPEHRDRKGAYKREDWTAVSDIGRSFGGRALTPEAYLRVEDAYVSAVKAYREAMGNPALTVHGLERSKAPEERPGLPAIPLQPSTLTDGAELAEEHVDSVVRLTLREDMWCELRSASLRVRFGWDYYMYVGVPVPCEAARAQCTALGLFVEALEEFPGAQD